MCCSTLFCFQSLSLKWPFSVNIAVKPLLYYYYISMWMNNWQPRVQLPHLWHIPWHDQSFSPPWGCARLQWRECFLSPFWSSDTLLLHQIAGPLSTFLSLTSTTFLVSVLLIITRNSLTKYLTLWCKVDIFLPGYCTSLQNKHYRRKKSQAITCDFTVSISRTHNIKPPKTRHST